MITDKEIYRAGKLNKTHGVNGELNCTINTDAIEDAEYIVLNMDGIFVPFFISNLRVKSQNSVLLTLEGVDDESEARNLVGKDLYLPNSLKTDEEIVSYNYFIGFIINNNDTEIGEIAYVDEQTINTLFGVKTDNDEVLLPVVEDFIVSVDNVNRILYTNYPEELVNLNKIN